MMFLSGVDPQHVADVNSEKNTVRGCGKTIAKMVQLLSYLRYSNNGKRYLFICENDEMAKDVNYYFYFWINDIGLYSTDNDGYNEEMSDGTVERRMDYDITIHPPRPNNFWYMLVDIFRPNQPIGNIYVKFVPASWKIERGVKMFDKIIIDVSPEARDTYNKEISQVLSYGQ